MAGPIQSQSDTPDTRPGGGRMWWAHLAFTRINIAPTILGKTIEERLDLLAAELRDGGGT